MESQLETTYPRTGTQSIERSITLLRELATRGSIGWGLWDLAARCSLDRGTTHRILACLVRERLVHQRSSDRHYVLGPLTFELGVSATSHAEFQLAAQAELKLLTKNILKKAVGIVYLRSGDDCVCIVREGVSAYTRERSGILIGNRAPLLSLAGGGAILASLPDEEAAEVMERNMAKLAHMGEARLLRMRKLVLRSVKTGYIFSDGVVWSGVNSYGVSVINSEQLVIGSAVVSGSSDDYSSERINEVVSALQPVAQRLSVLADGLPR